jgi:hypothetical protein
MAEKIAGAYIELVPQLAKNFKQQVEKDAQTAGNAGREERQFRLDRRDESRR